MFKTTLCLGALVAAVAPACADDLRVPSAIASVTVYPVGAAVVRTAHATLPAGSSVVLVDGLPQELDADSLKVEGSADHPIAIASVETRLVAAYAEKDPRRVAIEGEIEALQDKLAVIGDRLGAIDGRRRFLERLIEATPAGFGKGLAEGTGNIDQWTTATTTIGAGLTAIADETRAAKIAERDINRQLDERNAALADLPAPAAHVDARIALSTDAPTSGTLSISYRTPSARWVPTYDAHLTIGEGGAEGGAEPSLTIVRRAEVTQATGEDWDGVEMTLSTAAVAGGTAAPDIDPLLVSLYDPSANVLNEVAKSRDFLAAPAPVAPAATTAADSAGNAAGDTPAEYQEAAADFGDFRAEYHVPGRVSVESGEGARSLQIATEKASAKLMVRSVPMLSDAAYLQAAFTPPAGAPLLPGRVALFRDGTFVGNGSVPFTNAGREIDLGFGVDDRVRVVRTALDRETGEHGILSSRKTDRRRYKISVENLHARPMDITVLDRVPYAEDENVSITRLAESSPATVTDVDDKRGVLAWTYTYGPGESRDILNGYEVTWPAGQSVVSLD
jgi:uncharacterized protein (TIGR02231 family)